MEDRALYACWSLLLISRDFVSCLIEPGSYTCDPFFKHWIGSSSIKRYRIISFDDIIDFSTLLPITKRRRTVFRTKKTHPRPLQTKATTVDVAEPRIYPRSPYPSPPLEERVNLFFFFFLFIKERESQLERKKWMVDENKYEILIHQRKRIAILIHHFSFFFFHFSTLLCLIPIGCVFVLHPFGYKFAFPLRH